MILTQFQTQIYILHYDRDIKQIFLTMCSSIKPHVHIHHNKMELLSGTIVLFLRLPNQSCLNQVFMHKFSLWQLPLLTTCSLLPNKKSLTKKLNWMFSIRITVFPYHILYLLESLVVQSKYISQKEVKTHWNQGKLWVSL